MKKTNNEEFSIVALDKFILATRDSVYKGTASAVAELVDNSLQAGATEVRVTLTDGLSKIATKSWRWDTGSQSQRGTQLSKEILQWQRKRVTPKQA